MDPRREARKLATTAADSPTLREWQALARRYRTPVAGGFCELGEDGLLYNSAAFVGPAGSWPSTARHTCGTPRSSSSHRGTHRRP
jgi:predicted amidohydrolase